MNLEYASVADVVSGDRASIELLIQGWRSLGTICSDTAAAVEQIEASSWKGMAADACSRRTAAVPVWLRETSELVGQAVGILYGWLDHVAAARVEAGAAIATYEEGRAQHRWWLENHAAIEQGSGMSLPDPGLEMMAIAERRATRAREDLDAAGVGVGERLRAIADAAFTRFSAVENLTHSIAEMVAGAGEATWSLLTQASLFSPLRWAFDHNGASRQATEMGAGLKAGVGLWFEDPEALLNQAVDETIDLDGLVAGPARWVGHLVPDLVASVAGIGMARRGTRLLDDVIPDVAGPAVTYPSGSGSMIERVTSALDRGRRSWVSVVDSEDDLRLLFFRFARDGTPVEETTYGGQLTRLADGTRIGIREFSSSGGATIDITLPDGSERRIHVR